MRWRQRWWWDAEQTPPTPPLALFRHDDTFVTQIWLEEAERATLPCHACMPATQAAAVSSVLIYRESASAKGAAATSACPYRGHFKTFSVLPPCSADGYFVCFVTTSARCHVIKRRNQSSVFYSIANSQSRQRQVTLCEPLAATYLQAVTVEAEATQRLAS